MTAEVLSVLARRPGLSAAQLRGVTEALARSEPHLLAEVASRADVTAEVAEVLARVAPSWIVVDVLDRLAPDVMLFDVAVEAHGALPELVVLCGRRGWLDHVIELAERVDPAATERVVSLWERSIGPVPLRLRVALVHAALAVTDRVLPDNRMTSLDRKRHMDSLIEAERVQSMRVWGLLEPTPGLWLEFAADPRFGIRVQRILLEHAPELPDEVLRACFPAATGDALRQRTSRYGFLAGFRLAELADVVRRWPRLKEVGSEEIRRVVRETQADGWTPAGDKDSHQREWDAVLALAELCDDPTALDSITDAFDAPDRPAGGTDGGESERWREQRLAALVALLANPQVPVLTLVRVVKTLEEHTLAQIAPLADGLVAQTVDERLAAFRAATAAREAELCQVPSDDDLERLADPTGELRKQLRRLRGPAAQRDATCAALLRSRFTTPDLLRELPTHAVLEDPHQVEHLAEMIAAACADETARWVALTEHLAQRPGKAVTFGAWLDQLAERH